MSNLPEDSIVFYYAEDSSYHLKLVKIDYRVPVVRRSLLLLSHSTATIDDP